MDARYDPGQEFIEMSLEETAKALELFRECRKRCLFWASYGVFMLALNVAVAFLYAQPKTPLTTVIAEFCIAAATIISIFLILIGFKLYITRISISALEKELQKEQDVE